MANQQIEIVIKAVDKFTKNFKGLTKGLDNISKKTKLNSDSFKKMAGFGTLAFGSLGFGIKKLTDGASDLVEINQKFGVVYSKMSTQADNTAQKLSKGYGLAQSSAKGYLADIGDLVSGLGFSQKASLEFGEDVVSLGTDLASFSNIAGGSEEAIDRLKKGLLGEHENLKELGVQIDDNMVKEQLKANSTDNLTGLSLKQAKVEARLQLVLLQSKNAIGDYERSSDSLAKKSRLLSEKTKDLTDTLGAAFYPIVLKVTEAIIPIIEKFTVWAGENEKLVKVLGLTALGIAGVVTVFGTLGLIVPSVIAGIGGVITVVKGLSVALNFLALNPIGLLVTAIIGLGVVIYKWYEDWDNLNLTIRYLWEKFTTFIVEKTVGLKDSVLQIGSDIYSGFTGWIGDMVDYLTEKVDKVISYVSKQVQKAKTLLSSISSKVGTAYSNVGKNVKTVLGLDGTRATGGPVGAGKTYLVGEKGPELFTPNFSGNITANDKLGSSGQVFNISVSGNNISNQADENRLVEKIKNELSHSLKMASFGIS